MPTQLESLLQAIARQLVTSVLAAVGSASVAELGAIAGRAAAVPARGAAPRRAAAKPAAPAKGAAKRRGRAPRRSSDEVGALQRRVVDFVRGSSGGVAISDIAAKLGVDKADLPRPLTLAVASGAIRKTGEKRLTRYFPAGGGAAQKGAPEKRAKKASKKGRRAA